MIQTARSATVTVAAIALGFCLAYWLSSEGGIFHSVLIGVLAAVSARILYDSMIKRRFMRDGNPTEAQSSPKSTTVLAALQNGREQNLQTASIILLGGWALLTGFEFFSPSAAPADWAVTSLAGGALVLQACRFAFKYRLRSGLYGTNEYEARQVIHFVLDNADNIDLSGGLGGTRLELDEKTQEILSAAWSPAKP